MSGDLPGLTPLTAEPADESAPPRARAELELQPPSPEASTPRVQDRTDADELWATTFGDIAVAENPTVVAVRGDDVYVGGDFWGQMAGMPQETYLRVAHWDGSSWRRMGDGVDAAVRAIAVVGDDVYVGGEFTTVANGTLEASGLARWDGQA